ncbi:MAG: phytanoyl-CoA dioxygenase family protein [Rhodovibrionaceae bacterium]
MGKLMLDPAPEQIADFARDGFLIVERFLDPARAEAIAARFAPLFRGDFEAGLQPDEWNWREGRDDPGLTRQICNAWKADRAVAGAVLDEAVGRWIALLMDWPGARINQDNVIWKPPGAKSLGFHQDDSYQDWIRPQAMATCWMALDDTSAAGGTIEYVRGSHLWDLSGKIEQFHAPEDEKSDLKRAAAAAGADSVEVVPIEVPRGGVVFHHGRTWHGSGPNRGTTPRRSVVAHCMRSDAEHHPTIRSAVYSRYKRAGETRMEESFFPILWTRDGYRSGWLRDYLG